MELEWAAGGITLKHGSGTLSVSESGGDALATSERLHWWLDGTTLRIKYCESGFTHIIPSQNKHLTLELPINDRVDLKIDVASGGIYADALHVNSLDVKTASGGIAIDALDAGEAHIDSASGGIRLGTVTVDVFSVDTASGGLSADRLNARTVKVDSASGGITLGLDTMETVDIDVASGRVTLSFSEL